MSSTPISVDDASMTSGTQTPLSSHPSKKFRVSRSGSKRRVAICSIRRRPDSVFSRRGTDTPVQIVAPFSDSLPQTPLEVPVSRYSSKRWIMGRSKQPELRGCVLRAVPKAAQAPALPSPIAAAPGSPFTYRSPSNPLSHAHVDATMATSPNEEILSNIGQSPAPTPSPPYFPSVSPSLPPKKGRKERKSEGDAGYIGVWKDGKAHWEAEVAAMPPVPHLPNTSVVELDSRPIRLETPVRELPSMQKDKRPRIQVIIPNDLRNRAPHARPPFVSQAVQHSSAGEIISSRDVSPPLANDMIQVRNSAVSPIAHQILTHRQQTVPVYLEQVDEVPVVTKHPSISSSSGMSTSEIDDSKSSVYTKSNRTSWTSIDDNLEPGLRQNLHLAGLTASKAYSIVSPTEAGIFDDATPIHSTSSQPRSPVSKQNSLRKDKPLPPEPQAPSIQQTVAKLRNSASTPTLATRNSIASRRNTRRNQRVTSLPARGLATANGSVPHSDPPSPTLSEAETALEEHLSCILENSWDDVPSDHGLGSSRIPSTPAPIPPRKSSRRKRVVSLPVGSSTNHIAAQQVRPLSLKTSSTSSSVRSHGSNARGPRQPLSLTIEVPSADLDKPNQRTNNTTSKSRHRHKRTHARRVPPPRVIAPDAAEHVILGIFERIDALKDLFSLARVNRGFYRVFKRHELRLIRTVLQNECPPAWEHRESSPPYEGEDGAEQEQQRKQQQHLQVPNLESAHPEPEHTATTFYRHHMRDARIIGALKSLVLTRCQSFLRPETVMALASSSAARAARIDKAFWRIWTFCTIFGCGKGREDDIVGQMDWLRGGPLVHQTSIRATIMTSDSFDASSALLNASEHFAKGNGDKGLSAEELYDMTEIWTCMGVLISVLEGRTEQAREFGVFEMTDVRGGDIDGEEKMLQEWIYYVSTLGLSVVLELANAASKTDPDAFVLALENGWMDWTPPQHSGSRRTFLKEAVARVYEEKIAAMAATTPQEDDAAVTRQVQAQRMAAHKAEIHMRRRTGDYALVRMSMERPMSEWEGVFNRLDNSSSSNESIASPQPRRHVSTSSSVMASAPTPCPAAPGPSVGRSHSELIALPPMPEHTTVASSVSAARHTSLPVPPTYVHHQQMQERMNAGGRRSSQQNPLLQTLAHSKQYDYGVSASPTEQHPALRSTPSSSSFRGSDSGSRRGSTDSGVSPVPGSNGRLFSEEAVHPAFRNVARPQHHSPVSQSRQQQQQQQQQQPQSSNSSVSSMSATAPSPNVTLHQGLPPSYTFAQQQQQQQQQAVKHSQNTRYYSQHHHNYHQHPPAHPAYPYSAHRHGSIASQPPPPPSSYQQFQYQQQQQQQAHQRHHSLPASYSSPSAANAIGDPLPAHRHRVSTQHPFQQEILSPQRADPAANSADKAIFRIVEMGFTADEAKMALRRTDAGDGLRVDRAVEFLLSR